MSKSDRLKVIPFSISKASTNANSVIKPLYSAMRMTLLN